MTRFDLMDFEWSAIEPILPRKVRGIPRVDDRRVLNGIFWRLRTGTPWIDIPARAADNLRQPLQPVTQDGSLGTHSRRRFSCLLWEYAHDRLSSIRMHQHAANG